MHSGLVPVGSVCLFGFAIEHHDATDLLFSALLIRFAHSLCSFALLSSVSSNFVKFISRYACLQQMLSLPFDERRPEQMSHRSILEVLLRVRKIP